MAYLRILFVALSLATLSGSAIACSLPPQALRGGFGCGFGMVSVGDRELGILAREWGQVFRIVGEYDESYMYAPIAELPAIESAFQARLNALRADGNPIASLALAFDGLRELNKTTELERSMRFRRSIPLLAEAATGGSFTAMALLVGFLSDEFGQNLLALPTNVETCWQAAAGTLKQLPKEFTGVDRDDYRLWAGRGCMAPTLEALRN